MKKILLLIPILLILAALSGCVGGDGMADFPITNVVELQALGNLANLAEDGRLLNDIDATGFAFTPIGAGANPFTGSFDGQGFVITGLTVNQPATDEVGLFGRVTCVNEIRNVELRDCNVIGASYVGALIGFNNGAAVTNCHASGSVSSPTQAVTIFSIGGLIGGSVGLDITNCSFEGTVTTGNTTTVGDDIQNIGGLLGGNNGGNIVGCHAIVVITIGNAVDTIHQVAGLTGGNFGGADVSDSYAEGSITTGDADHHTNIAGFIGWNALSCDISDCYDSMDISIGNCTGAFGMFYIGGFIGRNDFWPGQDGVSRCRTSGSFVIGNCTVSGFGQIGGFIGYNEATISQCSSRRNVVMGNAAANSGALGGFIGSNMLGDVSDSYARGNVTIGNVGVNLDAIGGFCGSLNNGNYVRVYSVGSVNYGVVGGAVTNIGGLVGDIVGAGTVNNANCFWDTETSGQATSDGGTGHTTAEMNAQSTFTDAGWDFDAVWSICDPPQPSYPWLQWENVQCLGVIISLIG